MCGIVGFTGKKRKTLLSNLLKEIGHRGLDETSYYYSSNMNLGMNRFSIIDLSKNLYPMKYKNYVLIFNGEIYNFKELKKNLSNKGLKFSTKSDAEVILPLYHLYKERAFGMLEGMFAIGIYNTKTKMLILARDKSGEKPLYYYKKSSFFIFASEIKAILSYIKEKKLNHDVLSQYLRHGSFYKEDTLVKNVKKIRASKYLTYDTKNSRVKIKKYWDPKISIHKEKSTKKLTNILSVLIKDSVEKRLIADVPVGCFLSGGVDSSLISYFVSQKIKNLNTFSVSFPGYLKYDESKFSKLVSDQLKTNHTEIICTPSKMRKILDNIGYYIDDPIVDPAFIPTLLLAKKARKKVKVVLTGEGADELFGGYYRYHKILVAETIKSFINIKPFKNLINQRAFPNKFRKLFTPLGYYYSPQNVWVEDEIKKLLINKHIKRKDYIDKSNGNLLYTMQVADYKGYLAEQLLMKNDKATMIHNLESRAPYLDTKIVEFGLSLPNKYKVKHIHGKYILKKVAEKYLPKHIAWRPKHGFSLPIDYWFRKPLKKYTKNSINDLSKYEKIINLKYLESIIKEHLNEDANHGNKIFSMIVLGKWLKYNNISL